MTLQLVEVIKDGIPGNDSEKEVNTMSDRFYSALEVSGPNAGTAEHAAIEALKAIDHETYDACWVTAEEDRGPCFFDHDSGQSAIFTLIAVAKKFPTEKFVLSVVGGCDEGVQGPFIIKEGGKILIDRRSREISCGDGYGPPGTLMELTSTGELREIGRENKILWWFRGMRYLFRRTFRIAIYNFCPCLVEMIYGPSVTPTHVAPRVHDMTEKEILGGYLNMAEVLGAGTHKPQQIAE